MKNKIEFKVQVDEDIVQEYGKDNLETYLQEYLSKAILRLTAKDILDDLKTIDIDDNSWQQARERAWQNYGQHYFLNVCVKTLI